jgi:hypothetical protein
MDKNKITLLQKQFFDALFFQKPNKKTVPPHGTRRWGRTVWL